MDSQGADTLEKGLQDAPPPYPGLEDGTLYPVLTTTGKFYQYPHLFMSINNINMVDIYLTIYMLDSNHRSKSTHTNPSTYASSTAIGWAGAK